MENMFENLGSYLETFIEKKINEKFDEICGKQLKEQTFLNSTINSDELCKRWGICKNTLANKEKEGIIHPLPTCGKRKVYSMSDVINAENTGHIKSVYRMVG